MFEEIPKSLPLTPLLDKVDYPSDLKTLCNEELVKLATELREFLLYSVGQTGGHFGAGLGVVELTIALHAELNTPTDDLIWDVGHQAYPHKILTGRRQALLSIRQQGGLAPFPSRDESEFDNFGVGHSSTSISAALGMALAKDDDLNSHTVAVIGDGALTAGMAFEALNHAAHCRASMLIVLNDNNMSIGANVGGLAQYLENTWRDKATADTEAPSLHQASLFDDLGIPYSGPVDGHNIEQLRAEIKALLQQPGPKILHVQTTKGHGFKPAVDDPVGYHALTKLEKKADANLQANLQQKKFQTVFGEWICRKAESDQRLIAITPAMREGSGLVEFSKRFPDRFYDVAIAEQHAVTFAAGLACKRKKPLVAIYSTFLQRAYDQVVHDVAIQNLDVTFAIDRAGIVGEDGATHTGAFDIPILRCLPNFILAAPSSEIECRLLLDSVFDYEGPSAIRYPRGVAYSQNNDSKRAEIGEAKIIREGINICLLNFGSLLEQATQVCASENFCLIDMRWIKPLDEDLLKVLSKRYHYFVSLEDGSSSGGAGSAVVEFFNSENILAPLLRLGLPDRFIDHATRKQAIANTGLNSDGILDSIKRWMNSQAR